MTKYFNLRGLGVCLASFALLAFLDVLLLLAIYVFYQEQIALIFVALGYLLSALTLANLVILVVMCVRLKKKDKYSLN